VVYCLLFFRTQTTPGPRPLLAAPRASRPSGYSGPLGATRPACVSTVRSLTVHLPHGNVAWRAAPDLPQSRCDGAVRADAISLRAPPAGRPHLGSVPIASYRPTPNFAEPERAAGRATCDAHENFPMTPFRVHRLRGPHARSDEKTTPILSRLPRRALTPRAPRSRCTFLVGVSGDGNGRLSRLSCKALANSLGPVDPSGKWAGESVGGREGGPTNALPTSPSPTPASALPSKEFSQRGRARRMACGIRPWPRNRRGRNLLHSRGELGDRAPPQKSRNYWCADGTGLRTGCPPFAPRSLPPQAPAAVARIVCELWASMATGPTDGGPSSRRSVPESNPPSPNKIARPILRHPHS